MGSSAAACLAFGLCVGAALVAPARLLQAAQANVPRSQEQVRGLEIYEEMLQRLDPDLLQRAASKGIYSRSEYPLLRRVNPFFVRGDFNGDGRQDLAVWVTQRASGLTGVAVIHSTLDVVRYLGAGHGDGDLSGTGKRSEVVADTWRVLPAGSVVRPFTSVPEIGAVAGRPFTFRHEALEFVWLGKSSFAFYWSGDRYWEVWTGD